MSRRSIVVVSGGLNEPSTTRMLGDMLASATRRVLGERGVDTIVDVVELRDHANDLTNRLTTGFASGSLTSVLDTVAGADGLIVVTPVLSGSYSGLFKIFFDVLDRDALATKPVLIAATGGTPRHSLVLDHALRPLFGYLGAVVVPTGVFAATEDWGAGSDQALPVRAQRAGAELAALVAREPLPKPIDAFDDVPSFERLLGGD